MDRITVPLICPSAPSAERPAAPPAALRRGFARPGRCFAPDDALRPSPDILRRIHPAPLLGGGAGGRPATATGAMRHSPPVARARRRGRVSGRRVCRRPRPPASSAAADGGAGPELPECPGKGAARPAPHSAPGKAFCRPPVRIRRISGEFKADALARRARQPVSTSYCTDRRSDGGGTASRSVLLQLPNPKASCLSCLSH